MQCFEPGEIAVVRENSVNAMFPAHSGNLGIKHQVAARIQLSGSRKQPLQKLRPRLDDLATWSGWDAFDELCGLRHSRRRVEHPHVRYHPHELRDAEQRECPSFHSFAQSDEP